MFQGNFPNRDWPERILYFQGLFSQKHLLEIWGEPFISYSGYYGMFPLYKIMLIVPDFLFLAFSWNILVIFFLPLQVSKNHPKTVTNISVELLKIHV